MPRLRDVLYQKYARVVDQLEYANERIVNQRRALAGLGKAYYAARKNEEAFGWFVDATTFEEFRAILKRVAVQKMSETEGVGVEDDVCDCADCCDDEYPPSLFPYR